MENQERTNMDEQRFDAALRALHTGTTRRRGLAGMLAVLLGSAGLDAAAKGSGNGPAPQAPCGDGGIKANRCKKNGDCCTKYCVNGSCRFKPNYMPCGKNAECDLGRCVDGRCDGGANPMGAACQENFNCDDGLACIRGSCTRSNKVKCTKQNCPGCCEGTVCRVGNNNAVCGEGGIPCIRCRDSSCQRGICKAAAKCWPAMCSSGCCDGNTCKPGTSRTACGSAGRTCKTCPGGQICQDGTCQVGSGCSPENCATGCCSGGTCVTETDATACGTGGAACVACSGATPACTAGACVAAGWSNETTFGTLGTGDDKFYSPRGVAVSADGLTAYVADTSNHRISVWTRPAADSTAWTKQTTFGTQGTGASNFKSPNGVAVSADELTVWVADFYNNRISVWTRSDTTTNKADWKNQATFGTEGVGNDNFKKPNGVAVSADELTVWVSDQENNRVTVWSRPDKDANKLSWDYQAKFGNVWTLGAPMGVAVTGDALTALVTDNTNGLVRVFTRPDTDTNKTSWSASSAFGTVGTGSDNLNYPYGVDVSKDGLTAWIADAENNRISVWTRPNTTTGATNWTNKTTFGTKGGGVGTLSGPTSVSVTSDGLTALVCDVSNDRISVWSVS
jgi:DNA-binding beta-propeller fold protein YncE